MKDNQGSNLQPKSHKFTIPTSKNTGKGTVLYFGKVLYIWVLGTTIKEQSNSICYSKQECCDQCRIFGHFSKTLKINSPASGLWTPPYPSQYTSISPFPLLNFTSYIFISLFFIFISSYTYYICTYIIYLHDIYVSFFPLGLITYF